MFQHQYFVDEKKQTVVCKLTCEGNELVDDLMKHQMYPADTDAFKDALIREVYVGKAKCMPGDTWDEKIGRRIAYKKAVAKFNQAKLNKITAMEKGYYAMADSFASISYILKNKYNNAIESAISFCEKISGNSEIEQ